MASPFPGMDPYLERHWLDVHSSLVVYARNQLQPQLPAGLVARSNERLVVDAPYDEERAIFPDVRVVEQPSGIRSPSPAASAAVAEPLVMHVSRTRFRQPFVEVRETGGEGRLITVIEFLSPTNKRPGDGRKQYLRKRDELVAADVNLVEIDLTQTGRRELLVPQSQVPPSHRTTYQASVYTAWADGRIELYAMPLREPLPIISVPLREADPAVTLSIRDLIHRAYEDGGYGGIDYRQECEPPLDAEDAAWAGGILHTAGRR